MTSLWRIRFSFRVSLLTLFSGLACAGATVEGRVDILAANGQKLKVLSNVVVWLEPLDGGALPQPQRAKMLQQGKSFEPHLLVVDVGSTVDFPNLDPIFHNAFSSFNGQIFDIGLYPPGTSRSVQFKRPGIVRIFCNIHPTMSAVIAVLDTPYWALSKANGEYAVRNVPPGSYRLNWFEERTTNDALAAAARTVVVTNGDLHEPVVELTQSNFLPSQHKNKYGQDYPRETREYGIPQ
jgi:plastocyanin